MPLPLHIILFLSVSLCGSVPGPPPGSFPLLVLSFQSKDPYVTQFVSQAVLGRTFVVNSSQQTLGMLLDCACLIDCDSATEHLVWGSVLGMIRGHMNLISPLALSGCMCVCLLRAS